MIKIAIFITLIINAMLIKNPELRSYTIMIISFLFGRYSVEYKLKKECSN